MKFEILTCKLAAFYPGLDVLNPVPVQYDYTTSWRGNPLTARVVMVLILPSPVAHHNDNDPMPPVTKKLVLWQF